MNLTIPVSRVKRFAVFALFVASALRSEFIFETAPFPSCHASTIVEIGPGEFLAAWFGGTAEGKPDVAIWSARLKQGKWSAPVELAREPQIATYNPVLFHSADRTLWFYYRFGPHPTTWTSARRMSKDGGQTWSETEYLPAGLLGPIRNKPLLLGDGSLISGTSVESYQAWTSWIERSTDNGQSWTRHGPLIYPGVNKGSIQPAVVPLGPNRLRAFVRTTQAIGKVAYADSTDGGRTWTALKASGLPNPNSGIDAVGLKDGRIVMAYNHSGAKRSPLNLAVSRDGETWKMFKVLESEPGEYSYPAIIQASGGNLHVTYTWRRQRISHVEIPLSEIPH